MRCAFWQQEDILRILGKELDSWFQDCGIPVDGVINQFVHEQKRNEQDLKCKLEKNPKWFGIDLHFDDLDELAEQEGIYRIDPLDASWTYKVKQYIVEKNKTLSKRSTY